MTANILQCTLGISRSNCECTHILTLVISIYEQFAPQLKLPEFYGLMLVTYYLSLHHAGLLVYTHFNHHWKLRLMQNDECNYNAEFTNSNESHALNCEIKSKTFLWKRKKAHRLLKSVKQFYKKNKFV